jgi:O-6-methylguanine DNA methyltransferase
MITADSLDPILSASFQQLKSVDQPRLQAPVLIKLGIADGMFTMPSPAGDVYIAFNRAGVSALERVNSGRDFELAFRQHFGRPVFRAPAPARLARSVEAVFAGRSGQTIRYDLRSVTLFQRQVLEKALEIPHGQVRPYGWLAREVGHPGAQRAVGSTMARNPIPLLIPCHRVVRNDGIIGNYGLGGTEMKKTLLRAEGIDPQELEALARQGYRFIGSDTTGIFCFPTCRHAARIAESHQVLIHSADEAALIGFHPCRVCRPGPIVQ